LRPAYRKLPLALLTLLAACGGAPETAPGPGAGAPAAPAAVQRIDAPDLVTTWAPEALTAACEQAEKDLDAVLAKVVATAPAAMTFANSFGVVEDASTVYTEVVSRLHFMKDVHQDAKVREVSAACEERSGKYVVALGARKDLYDAMKAYLTNAGKTETLDAEQKRLIEITMRDFQRNGLDLPDEQRAKLVEIRKRLAELETRYHQRIGEDKTKFEVAIADLEGLPADFIARHEKSADGTKITLSVQYPDYFPVMENCKKESVRRQMLHAFNNRGGVENVKLLNEATKLRAEAARMLGFATHSDFVAQPNMAKSAKTIRDFLTRMQTGLKPGLEAFKQKMLALKQADTKDAKTVVNAWDTRYYLNEIRKREFAVDDEAVRAYFPAPKVLEGLFGVYARIFDVKFSEVVGAKVWAEGVKLFEMRDAKSNELTARFYVDMYPREGKYGHAAEFNMAGGHVVPEGYRVPLSVLVVNFEPPAAGKVAHLSVDEIETLFHEFGHVMHESLTTARYASLGGTNTARDFVEAPSQMLENWVYRPEVLELLSEDPAKPGTPMPRELMDKIIRARNYDAGVAYTRQVYLGLFDQTIHTEDAADADATAKRLWTEIAGFPEDQDTHFAAAFGHMMGGYDGGYYGYLWSLVFAADMFTRFQTEGVLNPATGRAYREQVLARGRTEDADVLLRNFLGREPNEKAFLEQLGIR
jgi:Zn-dependent oligopeptidase